MFLNIGGTSNMVEVICALVFGYFLYKVALPFVNDLAIAIKEEVKRVDREGLVKTDNGAFWSPDQDKHIKTKH
jgi:hypothetical protein